MKPLSTLGLLTGVFLMLLALGIWSASRHPVSAGHIWDVSAQLPAVLDNNNHESALAPP